MWSHDEFSQCEKILALPYVKATAKIKTADIFGK